MRCAISQAVHAGRCFFAVVRVGEVAARDACEQFIARTANDLAETVVYPHYDARRVDLNDADDGRPEDRLEVLAPLAPFLADHVPVQSKSDVRCDRLRD